MSEPGSSYVLLAVTLPVRPVDALSSAELLADIMRAEPWVEEVTVLNTIPAPGGA